MDAEVINRFIGATTTVLSEYFNISVKESGTPSAIKSTAVLDDLTVILGMTGDFEGHFLLGYNKEAALNTARAMMSNPEYPQLDDMCHSALSELANMIAGMTSTHLSELGYSCRIAPPAIISDGQGTIQFATSMLIALPVKTTAGVIRVCLGLKSGNGT